MDTLKAAMNAAIIQNSKSRLKYETTKTLIYCSFYWLRGQDLLKTLQFVLGCEVVAGASNRRYLHLDFVISEKRLLSNRFTKK